MEEEEKEKKRKKQNYDDRDRREGKKKNGKWRTNESFLYLRWMEGLKRCLPRGFKNNNN